MIDKDTGHITINSEISISPKTLLSELKSFKLDIVEEETLLENGWTHVAINNVEVSGDYLNLTFYFFKDELNSITFVIQDSPFVLGKGWDTWDEKMEKEKAEQYDQWLNKEIGPGRSFKWGTVSAVYDPRSGGSSINLRYN